MSRAQCTLSACKDKLVRTSVRTAVNKIWTGCCGLMEKRYRKELGSSSEKIRKCFPESSIKDW